ncbi:MAG TPA: ERF family protein [Alphaproteobacteria bacterium]|nr:ERF family protein [Alphaproteobacteria bacterium]
MAGAIDGQSLKDMMDGTIPCALEGERQSLTNMPEAVAGAINAVMGRIKGLLKTERNRAGGYRFASIDDFLGAVNPLCAKAGLIILQDELDARLVHDGTEHSNRSWLWATFTFTLAHKSGALYGPLTRSVMVPASGAQAFGAAQSYALKQFMRSLFQIPTGDREDADFTAPRRLPEGAKPAGYGNGNGTRAPTKTVSALRGTVKYAAKRPKAGARSKTRSPEAAGPSSSNGADQAGSS